MPRCASCESEQPDHQRFCGACGASLTRSEHDATRTSAGDASSPADLALESEGSSRFLPGFIFGHRFRIVGLLGRGGMGEVYRAEDLKLGQPVALKLLPPEMSTDSARLTRFLNEARVALRVTHPNVCRVFDIGEADGQHYLAMEYIDGEDLSSLLRRIGHLPREKAIQVARQLCAGLAAAHEQGIVHRDIKPANVMIDGRGRVRLTDFGLARAAEALADRDAVVGTPAYMAPEQREGRDVTHKSDLYSFGLVLHEMLTGRRAEGPGSGVRRSSGSGASRQDELDPALAKIIDRCLEPDPSKRPASALAVAAALPGADPLAAALADGETPSPELVAAAQAEDALRPAAAWVMLAAALVTIWIGLNVSVGQRLVSRVALGKPPDVLVDHAREVLRTAGYPQAPADSAHGFGYEGSLLAWVRDSTAGWPDWDAVCRARPQVVRFWYRQSGYPLVQVGTSSAGVTFRDPPSTVPGMMRLAMDPRGRLSLLEVVAPVVPGAAAAAAPSPERAPAADPWPNLFRLAGLDLAKFAAVDATWIPRVPFDRREVWEGPDPEHPAETLRVEAASFEGRPVGFRVTGPWRVEDRAMPELPRQRVAFVLMFVVGACGAALLARRNMRLGRSDPTAATRVTVVFLLVDLLSWTLRIHHVRNLGAEFDLLRSAAGSSLVYAGALWLAYVGFEPFVRRRWPHSLISWARLVGGRWRDPLVGRHVLTGCLMAGTMLFVDVLLPPAARAVGWDEAALSVEGFPALNGLNGQLAGILSGVSRAMRDAMGGILLLVVLRFVTRSTWVAAACIIVASSLAFASLNKTSLVGTGLVAALWLATSIRFGFLPGVVALAVFYLTRYGSGSSQVFEWHGAGTILVSLVTAAVIAWGFVAAVGGRPLIRDEALD